VPDRTAAGLRTQPLRAIGKYDQCHCTNIAASTVRSAAQSWY
jgi:hypothetical protein